MHACTGIPASKRLMCINFHVATGLNSPETHLVKLDRNSKPKTTQVTLANLSPFNVWVLSSMFVGIGAVFVYLHPDVFLFWWRACMRGCWMLDVEIAPCLPTITCEGKGQSGKYVQSSHFIRDGFAEASHFQAPASLVLMQGAKTRRLATPPFAPTLSASTYPTVWMVGTLAPPPCVPGPPLS